MYRGKHEKKLKQNWGKPAALLVSLVLLVGVAVGGTLAYLVTNTDPIENQFTPSKVTTTVEEKLDGNVKKNVKIKNTGDTEAWIRAAVVITWQDENGNVYGGTQPVAGTDYTIEWNVDEQKTDHEKWFKGKDGFYYWTKPVKSQEEDANNCFTGVLITECKLVAGKAPEGYALTVEIIGSGIQSKPADVFNDNWGTSSGLQVNNAGDTLVTKPSQNTGGGN